MNTKKILFVDDEQKILDSFVRQFRRTYEVVTAPGGEIGLKTFEEKGPFAVVVSDMQMPGMNGAQFLSRVSERWPDTIRVMLTGHADLETARVAFTSGHVSRFLAKPCPDEVLGLVLELSVQRYEHQLAGRQWIGGTVEGVMRLLTDVMELTAPGACCRARHLRQMAGRAVQKLGVAHGWRAELASMLLPLIQTLLSEPVAKKWSRGGPLDASERKMVGDSINAVAGLVGGVAGLERAGDSLKQLADVKTYPLWQSLGMGEAANIGLLLRGLVMFDAMLLDAATPAEAVAKMEIQAGHMTSEWRAILEHVATPVCVATTASAGVSELASGAELAADVRTTGDSVLVAARGQIVSEMLRQRLANLLQAGLINDRLQIRA